MKVEINHLTKVIQGNVVLDDINACFRKYSLGMKQRLGIAAAIVESPDLILLDEPFNALDESGIKEIRDLLRELRQKGKLIVLTCHDRQQMESLADEIIAMREGRIVNVDKNCHEEV